MKTYRVIVYLMVLITLAACAAPAAEQVSVAVQVEQEADQDLAGVAQPQATSLPAPQREAGGEGESMVAAEEEMASDGMAAAPVDGAPPDAMFFEDYGTNPFTSTVDDNLSTFAIDVDTGSYTLARRYLNDGYLPPPDAIRLEEFVNYFEQDYPIPQQEAFNIVTDAAPTPFSAGENVVMRVGIQGYDVLPEERPDATLIFVVDVSGSMDRENRLGAVKEALSTLVDELRPTDRIGIVIYGSSGRVLLEPTPVDRRQRILRAINRLQPGGSTNAEEGLLLAYQQATAQFEDDRINRLILCSDGVANVGATGPDAILETVRQQAREGITLTTVGFGLGNYNDVMMEQLADNGDGQYFYVDTQDEARRIFVDDLTGTLQTIARDAKIQVEFNTETVETYRLMGYENRDVADEDFRNDDVDAGEIGAGHSVTALYELVLNQQAQGSVATVRLRWEDPTSGEVTEIEQVMTVADIADSFESAAPRFRLDVAVAAFADILGAGAWQQSADLEAVHKIAEALEGELANDSNVSEFVEIAARAASLQAK